MTRPAKQPAVCPAGRPGACAPEHPPPLRPAAVAPHHPPPPPPPTTCPRANQITVIAPSETMEADDDDDDEFNASTDNVYDSSSTVPCCKSSCRPLLRNIPKTQSLDLRQHDDPPAKPNEPSAMTREMRARLLVTQQSRSLGGDDTSGLRVEGTRSPGSSPRTLRRRQPLRESRRVSIDASGSYLQLNQYKLLDPIGQVS